MMLGLSRRWMLVWSSLLVFACGGGEDGPKPQETDSVRIVSFDVSPREVSAGEEVKVRWEIRHADELELLANGASIELGERRPAAGEMDVVVSEETSFQLVAGGHGGPVTSEVIVVALRPTDTLEILSFAADPTEVQPGEAVVLSWKTQEATAVRIVGPEGAEVDVGDQNPLEGSVEVRPESTATYTLHAERAEERVERSLTVTVRQTSLSIGEFWADPAVVTLPTGKVRLHWRGVEGADTLSLVGDSIGQVDLGGKDLVEDSVDVAISAPTTFTLTARNDAGDSAEKSVAVTVGPPVIASFAAVPAIAGAGQPLTFKWEVEASSLVLLGPGGEELHATSDASSIAEGTFEFQAPLEEGEFVYELVARNGVGEEARAEARVVVQIGPRIVAFSADPVQADEGAAITFSWSILGDPLGLPIELSLSDGTTDIDLSGANPLGDSRSEVLTDIGLRRFTLTATTASGTHAAEVDVTIHGAPAVTLAANPLMYDGVLPVTLQWASAHAEDSLVLYALDEQGLAILPALYQVPVGERASGTFEVEPTRATTYRMVATNLRGSTATAEVLVGMAPPVIVSFEANPQVVSAGEEVTLTWTTARASRVSLDVAEDMIPFTEIADSFVDISMTGTPLILTTLCSGAFDAHDEGCATIQFPSGFTVPLFGEDRDSIRVYANGAMGFDLNFTSSTRANYGFPHVASDAINLAPFWDNLVEVEVWYEFGSDASGAYLLVQWSGEIFLAYDFFSDSSVNFQVLLREDGTVEYRYGEMSGEHFILDFQELADGASATIGYQSPSVAQFENLHVGGEESDWLTPVSGGLSHRSWKFGAPPRLSTSGSFSFFPTQTLDVTLTAHGEGQVSETIQIVVNP